MGTFAARSPIAPSVCQFRGDPVSVSKVSFVSRRAGLSYRIRASVEASDVGSSDSGAEAFNPFAPGKISSRMAVKTLEQKQSSLPVSEESPAIATEAPSSTATAQSDITPTPQVSSPFAKMPSATPSQIPSPAEPAKQTSSTAPAVGGSFMTSAKAFDLPDELRDATAERYKASMRIAVRQERMDRAKAIAQEAARKKAEDERMSMLLEDSESESEEGFASESDSDSEEEEIVFVERAAMVQPEPEANIVEQLVGFVGNIEMGSFALAMAVMVGIVIGTFVAADQLGAFRQVRSAYMQ